MNISSFLICNGVWEHNAAPARGTRWSQWWRGPMQLSRGGNRRQRRCTLSSTERACYPSVLSLPPHKLHHWLRTTVPSTQGLKQLPPYESHRFFLFHCFLPSLLSPMMQQHMSMLLRLSPQKTCSRYSFY